ncbi:MAG: hypothetical protein V1866_02440 [archaeon]
MVTNKDRRHDGYVTPRSTVSKEELVKYNIFIDAFYDDWENYRDGFRNRFKDFKTIKQVRYGKSKRFSSELFAKRIRMNLKQKKLLKRRMLRKLCKYY